MKKTTATQRERGDSVGAVRCRPAEGRGAASCSVRHRSLRPPLPNPPVGQSGRGKPNHGSGGGRSQPEGGGGAEGGREEAALAAVRGGGTRCRGGGEGLRWPPAAAGSGPAPSAPPRSARPGLDGAATTPAPVRCSGASRRSPLGPQRGSRPLGPARGPSRRAVSEISCGDERRGRPLLPPRPGGQGRAPRRRP